MDVQDSVSSNSSYSGSEEPDRPNRWTGPPSTWQALTNQERGLEASLIELRNRDLNIHLYNSFALKRKAREYREAKNLKPSPSPSRENDEADDDQDFEELARKGWAPPRGWTAWPLPPEQVPRPDEHVGPEDKDDLFTFKMKEKERPSRELEEVVVGTALKFARERWQDREMALSEDVFEEGSSDGEMMDFEESEESEDSEGTELDGKPPKEVLDGDLLSEGGHKPLVKKLSQPPSNEVLLRPVQSADDQRSRDLLRPSIRHTLSQLDEVLMALHYARQTCHRYAADSDFSSENDTDNDEKARSEVSKDKSTPEKKPRGRPRKFENLASRHKTADSEASEPVDVELWRTKKSHRGRPQRRYEALEGETQEEYLVRIARLQKKPLPSFASSRASSPRPPSSRGTTPEQSPVKKRKRSLSLSLKRERLDVRDWSEVLGSAALVGFNPDVIARTAQRCADLFGEGMSMRTLLETASGATDSHSITTYMPEEIPDLASELQASSGESEDEDTDTKILEAKTLRAYLPSQYNCLCPVENCPRQVRGFGFNSELMRHLAKSHGLTKDEASELLDDDEEMYGGVHVDGFLKSIKNPRGGRGGDKRQRNSHRTTRENSFDEDALSTKKSEDEEDLSISSGS